MIKNVFLLIILVVMAFCPVGLYADGSDEFELLTAGAGGRAIGMGGVFTAMADDGSAIYWNPAGLARLDRKEYNCLFSEASSYQHIGYSHPSEGYGTISYAFYYYKYNSAPAGYSGILDTALVAGYGNSMGKKLDVGFSIKYINKALFKLQDGSSVNTENKEVFSADLGAMYRVTDAITVAGVIQDLSQGLIMFANRLEREPWKKLPVIGRVGIAFKSFLNKVTLAIDGVMPQDGDNYLGFGCEFNMSPGSGIRIGYSTKDKNDRSLHYGISFGNERLAFDWVLVPEWGGTGRINRLGMTWKFGERVSVPGEIEPGEISREKKKRIISRGKESGKSGVAIVDFMPRSSALAENAVTASVIFREGIEESGVFSILGRTEMEELMEAGFFKKTECASAGCAVELGRLLEVQKVIVGSIGRIDNNYVLSLEVVDIISGNVVYSGSGECASVDDIESMVKELAGRVVSKLEK